MPEDAPKNPRRKKDAPTDENRRNVAEAVTEGMAEHKLTVAEISRLTGLSETTIYAVTKRTRVIQAAR